MASIREIELAAKSEMERLNSVRKQNEVSDREVVRRLVHRGDTAPLFSDCYDRDMERRFLEGVLACAESLQVHGGDVESIVDRVKRLNPELFRSQETLTKDDVLADDPNDYPARNFSSKPSEGPYVSPPPQTDLPVQFLLPQLLRHEPH